MKLRQSHYAARMLMFLAFVGSASDVRAQAHSDHMIGSVESPISCQEQSQREFNRAVALLHHMTYPQARAAFERIATAEPRCAMAHWGIAMTLFQPLWPTRPNAAALQRGWEEVQKAKAGSPLTQRERSFVAAAEAFFRAPESPDYWQRIRRWEQSMRDAHAALPDDAEISAFYALAHLATAPSDEISRTHADESAAILLRVIERNPDHPGAMHYLVHANDVPGRERELLEITRKYEQVAPRNPHALHMPTHIYTRLGEWDGVIRGNLRAAEAALEYPAGDRGQFVWDEYPHAIEYLVHAFLQKGADKEAAAQITRLRETPRLEPSFKTAFHLASTQARYALERREWAEAARIEPRQLADLEWDRFPWPEAISWFARGLGAAHVGDQQKASEARQHLDLLQRSAEQAGEKLFARNIQVLRLELDAWIAHMNQQAETSAALMREAAEFEVSTPKHAVTPGPTVPAHELLGDLLMEQGHADQALAAYTRSNELYPQHFNSLLGAARAARKLNEQPRAQELYRALLGVAAGGTRQAALAEAKAYVTEAR